MKSYTFYLSKITRYLPRISQKNEKVLILASNYADAMKSIESMLTDGWVVNMFWYN